MHRLTVFLCFLAALPAQTPGLRLAKVAGGLDLPTHIANAGDGSGRLYVVEQRGRVRYIESADSAPVFLDIRDRVGCCGERGLLGLAFPPGFNGKRRFYVYYTNLAGDIVISRFQLSASGAGDAASEQSVLTIPHRQFANHNGGQIAFGPEGYLYVGTGDGGGAGDPLGSGQRTDSLLGKLLRIDVESGGGTYSLPPSNPFVARTAYRPEIWALGLRNPWRFSFDRATGDLYIADVGQNSYEEVNWQPASSGGGENYGWNVMEGLHCYSGACNQAGLTLPVAEYSHVSGDCSVTGGFVYRGLRLPALQGAYFDSDYCSGRLRALRRQEGAWLSTELLITGFPVSTFGEDESGEMYVADHENGDIYRLESDTPFVTTAGVVNAASSESGISPGSLGTIYGSGFSLPPGIVTANGFPLPIELGGLRVFVNGAPAPLLSVANTTSGEQVNFQLPFEIAPGEATLKVVRGGVESPAVQIDVPLASPGIFAEGGVAAALRADYTPLNVCESGAGGQPLCPAAHPGEVILLYGTGLGPVANPPATGAAAPDAPLSRTILEPTVTVGGKQAVVFFSGLAPRFAGLYQLNVQIAADTPAGPQDVVVEVDGRRSRPAAIHIE